MYTPDLETLKKWGAEAAVPKKEHILNESQLNKYFRAARQDNEVGFITSKKLEMHRAAIAVFGHPRPEF